jgi:hypothetical protein
MRYRESRIAFLTLQYNFGKQDRSMQRGGRGMGPGGMGGGGEDMGM